MADFFSPVSITLVVAVFLFSLVFVSLISIFITMYTQTFLLNHMINKNMPNLEGVFVCSVIHIHTYSTHRERGRAQKGYNTLNISVQKCSCT